jgi:endo-1,4-beta-xylanase
LAFVMARRQVMSGLATAALFGFARQGWGQTSSAAPPASLDQTARRSGRFFGAAARADHINAFEKLREIVLRDCGWLTPEFHMNWDHIQPAPEQWTFEPADQLCAFARAHGMRIRGQLLLWEQSTPSWAKEAMAGPGGWNIVQRHFARTLSHYDGTVETWDVVNEAIDDHGRADGLRENVFFRAFGPDYVRRAFDEARLQAPTARLCINDYGFEYMNRTEAARRTLFLKLLEDLRKTNTPVDGVGLQAHLDLAKGPMDQRVLSGFLQDIADMGYDIVITELDVMEKDRSESLAIRDARVARETTDYLDVTLAQKAVRGVFTWGLSDRFSWLQTPADILEADASPQHLNRGLPYDAALVAKPMYAAIRDALEAQSA